MSDIVERLREAAANLSEIYPDYAEAADEITRLRDDNDRFRENELLLSKDGKTWRSAIDIIKEISTDLAAVTAERDRMREALKPFARVVGDYRTSAPDHYTVDGHQFSLGQLRRARAALEGLTNKSGDGNE